MPDTTEAHAAPMPAGDYVIVEILGHRTLIGRIEEVERFGTKMLSIEPIFNGALLPAVLHGGGSIYAMTPCTAEVAFARAPTHRWQLPGSVAATLPPEALPAPAEQQPLSSDDWDEVTDFTYAEDEDELP